MESEHDHTGHDHAHDGHDHSHNGHDHAGHDHAGHDHAGHDHGGHDHDEVEEAPDISEWAATTQKLTCPSCGAVGALTLGGGVFCPSCGAVSTSPGFQAPPA